MEDEIAVNGRTGRGKVDIPRNSAEYVVQPCPAMPCSRESGELNLLAEGNNVSSSYSDGDTDKRSSSHASNPVSQTLGLSSVVYDCHSKHQSAN